MSNLVIVVPAGRDRCGRAVLFGGDGRTRVAPFRVLATASASVATRYGNLDRDWRRPFGHSPTGKYVIAGSLPPGVMPKPKKRWWRFGQFGALILAPSGGNALEAARAGRTRFLLHGGATDSLGRLRPTFGGFRVSDRDLRALLAAVNDGFLESDPVSSVEVAETSTPSWLDEGSIDRAGRLRPAVDGPSRARKVTGNVSVPRAALIALGFGVLGRTKKHCAARPGDIDRRDFVGLALLAIGSLGTAGCSQADHPVPDHACAENTSRQGAHPVVDDAGLDGDDGGGAGGGYDSGQPEGATVGTGGTAAAPGDCNAAPTGDGYTAGDGTIVVGDGTTGDGTTGDGTTGDGTTGDGTTGDGTGGG